MLSDGMKRIAVLDKTVCTKDKCGYVCVNVCPVNKMKKECITIKDDGFPFISEDLCVGCSICVKKCPVGAITIINLTKDLGQPVYSYGKNAFRLHGLPIPKENAIVGLIGKNGIGKTTSIRLLTKQLEPKYDKNNFEYKNYFEHLKNNLSLSIKPQNINKMRAYNMKVKDLLKELGIKLDYKYILDRNIRDLSGGELQKLAIDIAISKKADFYYIDELTNYLDIKERLQTAIKLKEFAENKNLVVVDHDLIIFDYLVDYVYVFFGQEDVYGAVSSIKNARNGINEYLNGFLKSENLRIRDFEIKFSTFSEEESKKETIFSYPKIEKDFGSFHVHVESGEVRAEVIGIVGGNALGKTTFMKELSLMKDLNIAYKPQYLNIKDVLVKSLLKGDKFIIQKAMDMLNIKRSFLEKKETELSGGQQQRIEIINVLSKDADIYLLDEPTAFLDIEERLMLSELIRLFVEYKKKPVFVIDHDISFIDRISSRLILFKGIRSKKGYGSKPMDKIEGINEFLKIMDITMRRDIDTHRPKINKPDSNLDKKQRLENKYFG